MPHPFSCPELQDKLRPSPTLRLRRCSARLLIAMMAATTPAGLLAQEEGAPKSQLVEVAANDTRVDLAVAMINDQIAPNKVVLYGKTSGERVTVLADGVPVEDVLSTIANPKGWVWWREDNGDYGIADRQYYEQNILPQEVIQKVFRPNNIKASELDRAIKGLLTPNVGSSVADDRTNKLIVNDLPQALERIERFIREIDVQLIVRVFYIRHADVEEIAKKIENYKSDPGTIEVDRTTHQIIVTDLLSNIKKMELLIDILDVGPEIVIYDVNNIGIEGEDLEDLQKIVDNIRTEDLLFEVNEKQGVMILEDVPEVHEQVERILAEFDKPVRQVLLQSEILSTLFTKDFSFGLQNFTIAEDLSAAATEGALFGSGGGLVEAAPNFTNIYEVFPNASLAGNTLTGNYLSSQVAVQFQAVYNESSTRVLLQPRLLVKNQEPSTIFVGQEVPFLTTFVDDVGDGGRTTTTQSTVPSGLRFEVIPSISNSQLVELELDINNDTANVQEVTEGDSTRRLIGRDRQQVETTLQIPSGKTRMIGGLIRNNDSNNSSGLPFLSSLPVVGALFGQKSNREEASNLMIFITPTVVEEDEVTGNPGGRRGRYVSSEDRLPGQYELNLGSEDGGQGGEVEDFLQDLNEGELLSADEEEEAEALERIREMQRRRQEALESDEGTSNYQPTAPVGSTTLNARSAAPGEGAREGRPDRGGRPATFQGGSPNDAPPPPPRNETQY